MTDNLVKELVEIGLSEKEAKVYLASLELGPETAQKIAAKALVSRPNTYIAIESLTKRGLMSSFERGKKRLFRSENPEKLKIVVQNRVKKLTLKEDDLLSLIPKILASSHLSEMPVVRMFESEEGLISLQSDLLEARNEVLNIVSMDSVRSIISMADLNEYWRKIKQNKIKIRTLYTKKEGVEEFGKSLGCKWESRKIPEDKFAFTGEISIYDNKITCLTFGGKSVGCLIESAEIAGIARTMFNLAWEASENYQ